MFWAVNWLVWAWNWPKREIPAHWTAWRQQRPASKHCWNCHLCASGIRNCGWYRRRHIVRRRTTSRRGVCERWSGPSWTYSCVASYATSGRRRANTRSHPDWPWVRNTNQNGPKCSRKSRHSPRVRWPSKSALPEWSTRWRGFLPKRKLGTWCHRPSSIKLLPVSVMRRAKNVETNTKNKKQQK